MVAHQMFSGGLVAQYPLGAATKAKVNDEKVSAIAGITIGFFLLQNRVTTHEYHPVTVLI